MIKQFKFLNNNKSSGPNITIVYPDDVICPLMKEVYKDGYLSAMVGNDICTNRYLNTPYAYIWNRGWINQQMENQYERV